jgi:hypothetical protein
MASIGDDTMFDAWDHPTSVQVDKWTSGWWVHNNGGIMNHDFIHACDEFASRVPIFLGVCVCLSFFIIKFNSIQFNSIQFSGESFSFT